MYIFKIKPVINREKLPFKTHVFEINAALAFIASIVQIQTIVAVNI